MSDGITDASNHERKLIEEWQRQTIDNFLKDLSKEELVNELCKREGVKEIVVPRYENFDIYSSVPEGIRIEIKNQPGAARILVVKE